MIISADGRVDEASGGYREMLCAEVAGLQYLENADPDERGQS